MLQAKRFTLLVPTMIYVLLDHPTLSHAEGLDERRRESGGTHGLAERQSSRCLVRWRRGAAHSGSSRLTRIRPPLNALADGSASQADLARRFNVSQATISRLGAVLGVLVSISSVGAGGIGVTVLLMFYPKMPTVRIVGFKQPSGKPRSGRRSVPRRRSPSQRNKARAASACAPRCPWPNSVVAPPARRGRPLSGAREFLADP